MRTLKELAEKEGTVWVYLDSRKVGKDFLRQARSEGFRCRGMTWDHLMAIHSDLSVWYLPIFIWYRSYCGQVGGTPLRIDYEKYRSGEADYLCHTSHFRQTGGTV
jgi:hypothetical protein